jgi:hypothetical protein
MKIITIGRSLDNDVVISDQTVSGHHCQIAQEDNGNYSIRDIGSRNGTYVNGKRIHGKEILSLSDSVQIGNTTLHWQDYFPKGRSFIKDNDVVGPVHSSLRKEERSPYVNIPSDININQNISSEHADVRKRGDDFSVGFLRNLGDEMGSGIGKTLGCIVSIIIVIAILAIIAVTCS